MNKKAVITLGAIGVGLYLLRNSEAATEETGPEAGGGGGGGGFYDPLAPIDPNDPGGGSAGGPGSGSTPETPSGDYTGPDSDGDGVPDVYDVFPNDPSRHGYEQPDMTTQDSDGDGVQDPYDPFPTDASRGADTYDTSAADAAYPTSAWENPLIIGATIGTPIALALGPSIAKGIGRLTGAKPMQFQSIKTVTPKALRDIVTRRTAPVVRSTRIARSAAPRAVTTAARSGRAIPLPPRVGASAARVTGTAVPRVAVAPRLAAPTVLRASQVSRVAGASPAVRAVARVAPRIAAAMAAPAAQTAARVASRAATVATVATGGYVAARNVFDVGRASTVLFNENRSQADIDRAKALSGGAVARGTEFLSLGVVSINPNSGTRILNQDFSYATGENFGKGVKSIASGGKDKNRWTFWK